MREKINLAAKGEFNYDMSAIILSEKQIHIDVNAGENYEGTFQISNELKRIMKGIVTSDCSFMEFVDDYFQGIDNEIHYIFHAETIPAGENIKGTIQIISSCGTKKFPISVNVGAPACEISSGRIKDLFHFTNLAKEKPDEAASLFRNPKFEEIFLYRDNGNIALYRGLSKGTSKGMAMEEFLIAIHKKLPIQLTVNKMDFKYTDCQNSFTDKLVLTKNNWGFGEYHVESDSSFVIPEHKIIWTDDFVGDTYTLQFLVDAQKMLPGKNYARLTISTVRQKLEITIMANKTGESHEDILAYRDEQYYLYQLLDLYLKFCMAHIEQEEYLSEVGNIVLTMEKTGFSLNSQLFKIHLGIMQHREQTVKNGLEFLETRAKKMQREDKLHYCAYQYLRGLWTDDENVIEECVSEIRACYQQDLSNWKLFWFLLYLSPEYQSEQKKYEDIVKQLKYNCHSPVMFIEVCSIINDSPELLMELTNGICEAIHWGCKQNYINKEVALRYCYLAGKLKSYSKVVWSDLCHFYKQFEEDEILASICKILMKGQITSKEAFEWYQLGVEHNLKLTDLYEYYMYSIDENQEIRLQPSTLLYFLYDNHLTVNKKAMLYAYVVRNKEQLGEEYESYHSVIEEYTFRQLAAGRINSNLAVLYEEFIQEDVINETIAKQLPVVMFSHEIICENPEIIGVYVRHRELKEEEFVPLVNGKAIIHVFTENYQVFLADQLDNRFVLSIDYTENKLLNLDFLAEKCFEMNADHYRLLLYLYDKAERMNQVSSEVMEIRHKVLSIDGLSNYHYRKAFCALVRYYFDNFEGELLDAVLADLDWDMVNPSQRIQFIEYCAIRRFFDKAIEGIMRYGYQSIDGKRLLKISSEMFATQIHTEDNFLLKLAYHIFQTGNFDENMMKYLCKYYIGNISEMVEIWRYAKGFSIETEDYAERILGQIVFTEEMSADAYDVIYEYFEAGKNKQLLLAILKFIAYKYLVQNWVIPNKMLPYFYKEVQIQDNLFCMIATLKLLSLKKELTSEEKQFADYNINKLYERKIVFPFYRDFYGKISLPIHILDEHYVEYVANPDYEVKIHYLISSGYDKGEYVTETMRDVFYGIRVKEFVLFQDEILQYYISEIRPEGEKIIKSVSVGFDETMDNERTSSRYHMLNLMMIAQEMNEEGTLIDLMKEYVEMKESVQLLFKPIDM